MARGNGGSAVRVLVPKYNMSYEEMLKDNKIWVLCRVKYKVIKGKIENYLNNNHHIIYTFDTHHLLLLLLFGRMKGIFILYMVQMTDRVVWFIVTI